MAEDGLTTEQKKTLLRDHLIEAARLATEVAAEINRFGVSSGPEIPDLKSARKSPAVERANQAFKAATGELGVAQAAVGFITGLLEELGVGF